MLYKATVINSSFLALLYILNEFQVYLLGPINTERKRKRSKNKQKRSKDKRQTSKKFFAFARCEWVLLVETTQFDVNRVLKVTFSSAMYLLGCVHTDQQHPDINLGFKVRLHCVSAFTLR